jgi:NADPH2:quinone reductase
MRAVLVTSTTGTDGIEVLDLPRPVPGPGDVLVEVAAVAPAFPDLLLSQGAYQVSPDLPFAVGSDFAGVVVEAAAGSPVAVGARVAGCLSYGAAAELVAVPEDRVFPLPADLGFEEAAALPMNYLTAYYALVHRAGVRAGERVLVTGATGGVGIAAIQVARGLGCQVVALVSTGARRTVAEDAGAHTVVALDADPSPVAAVREASSGGVDVALDVVGGDVTDLLRCLRTFGRLMIVGFASGTIPTVRTNRLLLTNTDVRGVESARMFDDGQAQDAWAHLMTMVGQGHVRPLVRAGGGLDDYRGVLEGLAARTMPGRTVLSIP